MVARDFFQFINGQFEFIDFEHDIIKNEFIKFFEVMLLITLNE